MTARPFLQLHVQRMVTSSKWRRLPMGLRGAWITLFVLSGLEGPRFRRSHAIEYLEDELDVGSDVAEQIVADLVQRRWLDVVDDDVTMHDWHDFQPAYRGPSDDPEAKRQRMAELRASRRATGATGAIEDSRDTPPKRENVGSTDSSLSHGSHESHGLDFGEADDPNDPLVAWNDVTLRYPSNSNLREWIERVAKAHDPGAFRAALVDEFREDPSTHDLMTRVEARLARAADQLRRRAQRNGAKPARQEPEPQVAPRTRTGGDPARIGAILPGTVGREVRRDD